MPRADKRAEALHLAKKLIDQAPDENTRHLAKLIHARLLGPTMKVILEAIPGKDVSAKASAIDCSRTAFYTWWRGERRPRPAEAERIHNATGYPIHEILGRPEV